jgi:hypothetical protein
MRPIRTVGPEPLHLHVCGPHAALEVGDHLMLFTEARSAILEGQTLVSQQNVFFVRSAAADLQKDRVLVNL